MTSELQQKLHPLSSVESISNPAAVSNRSPTPQDLLELSSRIYKSSRKLYNEADSQGMRVYHDELIVGDVRLVMLVPSWFPKAHVSFDWTRVQGDEVSVVFVLRGTMQDLIGNTKANLQLLFNKIIDEDHLPDVAADATKVIQAWLRELLLRHTALDCSSPESSSNSSSKRLHLDVHVTGHSLGGLLAEICTVESHGFAAAHGASWSCTSFESPGLPDLYHRAALRMADTSYWNEAITGYLAAPNPINMLYCHLGRVVHVVVPWEQTWSHVAKCVGADVARITAWAIVGGMVIAGLKQLSGVRQSQVPQPASLLQVAGRRTQDEEQAATAAEMLAGPAALSSQQCHAILPSSAQQSMSPLTVGAANLGVSAAAPATAASVLGPAVPPQLLFTVAEVGGAAASRTLSSVGTSLAGAGMAAAAAAAGAPAGTATTAASSSLTAAAISAAAAAGDAVTSVGGMRILQHIARKAGLGVVPHVLGTCFFGRGGIWGVVECLAGVLGVEVEELIAQHSLCPMRQCFDPHSGQLKAKYRRDMISWPSLGSRRRVLLTAAQQVAKWTLPSFVCRDNVGVANILSRTAMVEARCARLQGYVVADIEQEQMVLDVLPDETMPGYNQFQVPLLEEQPAFSEQPQAVAGQDQQQHHLSRHPVGLLGGLSALPERHRLHRRLQPFVQQQHQLGDVLMASGGEAEDPHRMDAVSGHPAAAGCSRATAAAAELCVGLQSLQAAFGGTGLVDGSTATAMEWVPTQGVMGSMADALGDTHTGVEEAGAAHDLVQYEASAGTEHGAGWLMLDEDDADGAAQRRGRQRQGALLLPGF